MSIQAKIVGGLGNQIFIIACMLNISKKQQLPYYISKDTMTTPNRETFWNTVFHKLTFTPSELIPTPTMVIKEYNSNEIIDIPRIEGHAILDGYFQSCKYFDPVIIYEMVRLPLDEMDYVRQLYKQLKSKTAKTNFIHIRRGDYLQVEYFHIVLDIEWYKKALSHFNVIEDTFLIFSEDKEWCMQHLSFLPNRYIMNEKDYIELFLMGECDGGILSASTFSFWGAYFSQHFSNGQTFVCPDIWFKDYFPQKYMRNHPGWIEQKVF